MKTPSAALLLLLWAGLVVVAAEHKDLQEKSADTTSTQIIYQPDIHTALREMSTLVAKLEVELKYTKTQLDAVETRLRASEKTVEEQRAELRQTEARLTDSESLVQRLDKENEALKLSLNELKEKQEEQAAAVRAVGGSVNLTGSQVEELRREREERRVSFSASLVTSGGGGHIGPFATAIPLVYRHVFTNVGNCYNPNTGIFTSPIRGVYLFVVFVHGGGASRPAAVSLHKNGEHVAIAYSHQPTHSVNPSNGASLLLEVGDVVYVKLWPHAWVWDNNMRLRQNLHPLQF